MVAEGRILEVRENIPVPGTRKDPAAELRYNSDTATNARPLGVQDRNPPRRTHGAEVPKVLQVTGINVVVLAVGDKT